MKKKMKEFSTKTCTEIYRSLFHTYPTVQGCLHAIKTLSTSGNTFLDLNKFYVDIMGGRSGYGGKIWDNGRYPY